MASKKKNISALFDQEFTLTDSEGRDWVMRPPNKQRGMEQAVLYAGIQHSQRQGGPCKACGHLTTEGMESKTAAAWDQLQDREFEEVVLGRKMYDDMIAAEVSASEMHWFAMYTMWYWVLGEATADTLADAYAQSKYQMNADGTETDEGMEQYMDPKAPAPDTRPVSNSGLSTE